MAKRKGSPASRESASSSRRESEGACDQLRREIQELEDRHVNLVVNCYRPLFREASQGGSGHERAPKRAKLEEMLRQLESELEQVQRSLLQKRNRIEEIGIYQRLGKGPSTSRPRARSEAKTSEGAFEDECAQLRCEVRALSGKDTELSEQERELEDKLKEQEREVAKAQRALEEQERKLKEMKRGVGEQLRPLRRETEQVQQNLLPKRKRLEAMCSAREAESTQRLDKLPQEVWEKVTDHLEANDLFPLALSCRYFRQKQKELVALTGQHGPGSDEPRLALKTTCPEFPRKSQPASADYLRFCSKEKVSRNDGQKKDKSIRFLAAFHGHLPLLQELLKPLNMLDREIARVAGESSSSSSSLFWLLTSFSPSQRLEANWRPCSG